MRPTEETLSHYFCKSFFEVMVRHSRDRDVNDDGGKYVTLCLDVVSWAE